MQNLEYQNRYICELMPMQLFFNVYPHIQKSIENIMLGHHEYPSSWEFLKQ